MIWHAQLTRTALFSCYSCALSLNFLTANSSLALWQAVKEDEGLNKSKHHGKCWLRAMQNLGCERQANQHYTSRLPPTVNLFWQCAERTHTSANTLMFQTYGLIHWSLALLAPLDQLASFYFPIKGSETMLWSNEDFCLTGELLHMTSQHKRCKSRMWLQW